MTQRGATNWQGPATAQGSPVPMVFRDWELREVLAHQPTIFSLAS